jgi:site-specific DNA-methyltransferase (adenine-specific)
MGKGWDSTGIAYNVELWRHALRVLKPGGHLVAFGGSRTWHRLATAVEDAGFEIRDSIAWLYGSGFPKSLDVSKAIDREAGVEREREEPQRRARQSDAIHHGGFGADGWAPQVRAAEQWQGWGTALKPAFEPIIVGRKPLSGTVAGNVLTHGTGALNIDGCRVAKSDDLTSSGGERVLSNEVCGKGLGVSSGRSAELAARWPANVVLDESQAADLDRQSGTSQSVQRTGKRTGKQAGILGEFPGQDEVLMGHSDEGGASRFFPTFRYEAKAPTAERPRDDGVAHPTVKPLDLMRWLVRLVTPPGGVVLEPFAGSGTTLEASVLEGFACIGIELEAAYLPLICQRLGLPEEHVRTSLDRLDTETGEKPVPSAR